MEGLEVSTVKFKDTFNNKDFRIDTDFWTKQPKKNPQLRYSKIGQCLISSQYGISIEMNEDKIGFPIYRMNEIHNMLCDFDVSKHANITKEEFETFKLKDRDVLFNRTNSYEWVGRTGIYRKTKDIDYTFASYLVRFIPNQEIILPEYLSAFLNTKYGVWDIKRRARQSINQTNVNPEEVKEIDIPLLNMNLQEQIKQNFDISISLLQQSQQLYTQAEQLLLEELGLNDWQPSTENINCKSFKDSFLTTGRLDAEYYLLKYEELLCKIKRFETKPLGKIVSMTKSIEPGSDAYQDAGIPFVRISDITKFGITEPGIHLDENKYGSLGLQPKKDIILLSKDGSVGIAYKLEQDMNIITSGALLHLSIMDKEFLPEYLTLILNSVVVKLQAERDAGGSIIQHWKPSEIEEIIIPKLSEEIQIEITDKVQKSFVLKRTSEHLLKVAKQSVEIAVENNEEKAMEYINKNNKI
ncbi:restriction endonuclease subunit S [Parabacteroides bouchesdurhonensis]|uniref:restriction endonuclease subunit S n=1 Tax=Parabacteroides bouchesdurhonensis TaxID=1936995 RepID=UPI001D0C9DEB|nr:restriction endonuclease subunit S [Parabacteroides bouchesdurhonensis]